MKFFLLISLFPLIVFDDMKDSTDRVLSVEESLCSSLKRICVNEISIRNHLHVISMCIYDCEQARIDIKIESKENADQWKSTFNVNAIETMTTKTGNFKSFHVFISMLENAINQKSSSVSIDLFTSDDLQMLRPKPEEQRRSSTKKISPKRYLILIYNAEYDRIYYPLSLRYCGKPDPLILVEQIRQLTSENQLLKSQFHSDFERLDPQEECSRLKKENEGYRQQLLTLNSKEKDQQIDFLRQMIRTSEETLIKERNNAQKIQTNKNDRYKTLINQIDGLKTSERQLKVQVKSLTNEINILKQNSSTCHSQQRSTSLSRPVSMNQHRHRSASVTKQFPSSSDGQVRFNPTTYIHERNVKIKQIELQKKKETRQKLSSGRLPSDSDLSDVSLKSNNRDLRSSKSKKTSRQKRTNHSNVQKSKDLIDSDLEQVSSPYIFHKGAFNNSTLVASPEPHSRPNPQNHSDNLIDIDQRLKSLEKFLKQTVLH